MTIRQTITSFEKNAKNKVKGKKHYLVAGHICISEGRTYKTGKPQYMGEFRIYKERIKPVRCQQNNIILDRYVDNYIPGKPDKKAHMQLLAEALQVVAANFSVGQRRMMKTYGLA